MAVSSENSAPVVFWLSNTTVSTPSIVVAVATLSRLTLKAAVFSTRRSLNQANLMPASYCKADSGAPTPACAFSELKLDRWLSEAPTYGDIQANSWYNAPAFQLSGASLRESVTFARSGLPSVPNAPGTEISGVSAVSNQSWRTP